MSSFLVLLLSFSSTVRVFVSLLLESVFHLPRRIGLIGVPSITPPSDLNSMVPAKDSFFGLFFFWASRSGAHLPMIFASIPEGPRRNKNQLPTPPRQQQPSSNTPATPPMMKYSVFLLFGSPAALPLLTALVVRLGAGASSSAASSGGGISSAPPGTVSTVWHAGQRTFLPAISSLTPSFLPH